VPVASHACYDPESLAAIGNRIGIASHSAETIEEAMAQTGDGPILILGSLYLAGEVLRKNGQIPD
jgi:dihydrofolate synthase / folylpolyglutamate synthase